VIGVWRSRGGGHGYERDHPEHAGSPFEYVGCPPFALASVPII